MVSSGSFGQECYWKYCEEHGYRRKPAVEENKPQWTKDNDSNTDPCERSANQRRSAHRSQEYSVFEFVFEYVDRSTT